MIACDEVIITPAQDMHHPGLDRMNDGTFPRPLRAPSGTTYFQGMPTHFQLGVRYIFDVYFLLGSHISFLKYEKSDQRKAYKNKRSL